MAYTIDAGASPGFSASSASKTMPNHAEMPNDAEIRGRWAGPAAAAVAWGGAGARGRPNRP